MLNVHIRNINALRNRVVLTPLAILALALSSLGAGLASPSIASAQCSSNSVISCGVTSTAGLTQAYNADTFVQHVYSYFGISSTDVKNLGTTMTTGTVTRTGNVVVNGQIIATNAWTAGRQNMAGSTAINYQGSTFYKRAPSVSFLQNSLSAWIVMKNGQFAFAILPSCGNPVVATAKPKPKPTPKPYAVCKSLDVSKKGKTITATVTSNLQNGATYKTTTYNFGDGQAITTTKTTVSHTYSQTGTYTITAQQEFSTGTEKSIQPACQQTITISAPTPPSPTPGPPPSPMPSTGPADIGTMLSIFGGTTVLGTLGYRFRMLRKLHK